jgi:hypothetical protein
MFKVAIEDIAVKKVGEGMEDYYHKKIEEYRQILREKNQNLKRLKA